MSIYDSIILWAGTLQSFEDFNKAREHAFTNPGDQLKAEANKPESRLLEIRDGVAILSINGALTNSDAWWVRWMGMTSYSEIRQALAEAAERPDVSQILMDINSPGGAAAGLSDAADFVAQVDKVKPVHAFTDSVAASAAYWLMSSARKTYASSIATVGSIGVMSVHVETTKMDKEAGLNYTIFRSGRYKALGHPKEELSETAKQIMQSRVDYMDNIFLEAVANNRDMSVASAQKKVGEGREFIGEQAQDVGLIDKVTTFDEVFAMLAKKAAKATTTSTSTLFGDKMKSNSEGGESMKKTLSAEALAAAAASGASLEDQQLPEGATASQDEETQTPEEQAATSSEETAGEETAEEQASNEAGTEEAGTTAPEEQAETDDSAVTLLKSQLSDQTEQVVDLKVKLKSVESELESLKSSMGDLEEIARGSIGKMSLALGMSEGSAEGLSGEQLVTEHARIAEIFQRDFKVNGVAITSSDEEKAEVPDNVTPIHARRVNAASIK